MEKPTLDESGMFMQYPEVLLSPHFPLVRKECKEQSAIFFHCLTTKSQMGNEYDVNAAKKGAWLCRKEMEKYDLCMTDILKKEKERLNKR